MRRYAVEVIKVTLQRRSPIKMAQAAIEPFRNRREATIISIFIPEPFRIFQQAFRLLVFLNHASGRAQSMSLITNVIGAALAALLSTSNTITAKLLILKVYSQVCGSAAAKALAAADPTISAYASSIIDALNATSFDSALQTALQASGVTEDEAVSAAESEIESLAGQAMTAAGINATIQTLIIAIEEPVIQAKLQQEYEKLTASSQAA
jgi:hypothetical protein